jgi:hypothetical protein
MTWRLQRLMSAATRVLAVDRTRAERPLRPDGAELVAASYRMAEVGVRTENGRYLWIGAKGDARIGSRTVSIESLHGHELQLGAFVVGTTGDAIDVRQQLWSTLATLDPEGETDIAEVPGEDTFDTTSVISADLEFEALLGPIAQCKHLLDVRLSQRIETTPLWKVELAFNVKVGGTSMAKTLRFERRYTARPEEKVYFVQSPLHSDDHLEVLRKVFGNEEASVEEVVLESEAQ